MISRVLKVYFESFMTYATVNPPACLSYGNDFEVSEDLWNDLLRNTYDGEGRVAWLRHRATFVAFCVRHEIHEDYIACSLFAFMLRGHALQWCVTLPATYIHSFNQFIEELARAFHHYNHK